MAGAVGSTRYSTGRTTGGIIRGRSAVLLLVVALVVGMGLPSVPGRADDGWIDVNFHDWHVEGGPSDWRVEDGGTQARQLRNGEFTTMVSGVDNLVDVEMRGQVRVDTSSDNDLVGLVAGHRRPVAAAGDAWQDTETVIFGWKEQAQGGAPEGMKLASIDGTVVTTTPVSFVDIWFSDPPRSGTNVLDDDTGGGKGWRAGTWYDVRMVYRRDLVEVYVDGDLRLSAQGTFLPGRLGVYDQSQASAVYRNFQYRHLTSPPTADAGEDVAFDLARSVVLDGSGSSDPDGDVLSFDWQIVEENGGPFSLADAATANPVVTAEAPGTATIEVTVSDGTSSATDTVEVTATGSLDPTADAGLDQAVPEGSTVTLDSSGSVAGVTTNLAASSAGLTLPGGTSLEAAFDSLDPDASGLTAAGRVAIGQGPPVEATTLVYVLDRSGSTGSGGGCGGNQNGHGGSNTILDCEIAAVVALHDDVLASGTVDRVGLVAFSSGSSRVDLDPTGSVSHLVAPDADVDGDGILDLVEGARSLRDSGSTNTTSGVVRACDLLATADTPNLVAVLMSDGQATIGSSFASVLPCDPPVTFQAFGVGTGNSCDSGPSGRTLQELADLTDGTCTHVATVEDLPDVLPDAIASRITAVSYTIDGGDAVDLSDQLGLPITGAGGSDLAIELPLDLAVGAHELCLQVTGVDAGGQDTVETCSDLTTISGELTHEWRLIDSSGPPVFLTGATTATPSFVAPDDGTSIFEVTVTDGAGRSDTDRVTVTVDNVDPVMEVDTGRSVVGGVTVVSGSFTDDGWLDTHNASVDWGDGTVTDAQVAPQGSGWGALFGSHVYPEAGTHTIEVSLVDDDGGIVTAAVADVAVAEPAALWANSETANKTLDWGGGPGSVEGLVHSNRDVSIRGEPKSVDGPVEYVDKLSVEGQTTLPDGSARQVEPAGWPLDHDVDDFAPGGPVATAVGDAYHDMTDACTGGRWSITNEVLDPGVYYADCHVEFDGDRLGGAVTVVATGRLEVDGEFPAYQPYWDGLLFLAGASGDKALELEGATSKFLGTVAAPNGQVRVASSDNRFYCGIFGDTVSITGTDLDMRGADCSTPDDTSVGPLLVPDVNVTVDDADDEVVPGAALVTTVTVSHDGGQLVVPGLVGLENVDEVAAEITGLDYVVEARSADTGAWEPLASADDTLELSLQPNPSPGIDFAADGPVGTIVEPGAWATWGSQAILSLDATAVADVLDPAVTSGLRTRVAFDLQPDGVQARRLYTYGTDLLPAIVDQGAEVAASAVTVLSPVDGPTIVDADTEAALASLAPGDVVTIDRTWTAPVPAPRDGDEDDAGYLARLQALDGSSLVTAAFATGTGGVGQLVAPLETTVSTLHLPVVTVDTTGPDRVIAGDAADWAIDLAHVGSREAVEVDLGVDADGEVLTPDPVVPSELAVGELFSSSVIWTTPTSPQSADVRAAVTWLDAVGNSYGPLGSTAPVNVRAPGALTASLSDELVDDVAGDGRVSPGDTIGYELAVTNSGGTSLDDVAATVPIPDGASYLDGSASAGSLVDGVLEIPVGTLAAGATTTFTFDVVVDDPFPDGLTGLTTAAAVTAPGVEDGVSDDPDRPGSANATTTAVVVPAPVLVAYLSGELAIDADTSMTLSGGDTVHYELEVASLGSETIAAAVATTPVPAGTTLVGGSVATDNGTVTSEDADGQVVVDLGDLAPEARATITFDVTVDIPESVTEVSAQATVTGTNHDDVASDDPATFDPFGDPTVLIVHGAPGEGGGGGDPEEPRATIEPLTLEDGTVVTMPVDLSTTLVAPDGETVSWVVTARRSGDDTTVELNAGDGPDVAATFDPTVLANGSWIIEVTATTSAGAVSMAQAHVTVDGDFKPGRFVTTYLDLDVGVAGLPVQVRRSHDSFETASGDFGVGWSLDVVDFEVATNGPLGQGGWTMEGCGGGAIFAYLCFSSDDPHFVTVTWPDGRTEMFDLTPARGSTFFPGLTSAEFTARPGTTSELSAVDSSLFFDAGNLLGGSFGNAGIYNPRRFRLTDQFGTEYLLEVGVGLVEMRDLQGNTVTVDEDGITSSFGPGVTFTRDELGRITTVDGPGDQDLAYSYDTTGDLVEVIDPNGNATTYEYDDHRLVAEVGPDGMAPLAQLFYDVDGRLERIVDADGVETTVSADVDGQQQTVVSNDGRLVTTTTFDDAGRRIQLDETFGGQTSTTEFTHDQWGNVTSRRDPDGNVWAATWDGRSITEFAAPDRAPLEITYNDRGQPEVWTDQAGNETTYVWNPNGTLKEIVDANGDVESYTYNADGTRKSRTDREGNTWTWTYNGDGLVATEQDPRGSVTQFVHDAAGQLVERIDPVLAGAGETEPGRSTWTYDDVGNLTSHTDQVGNTTQWRYDALHRMVSRLDPAPSGATYETTWTWTDAGRVATETDPEGVTTTWTYGANGRAATMQVADLAPTRYGYDGAGRLVSETDPVGRETTSTFDAAGRLAAATNPAGGTTTYGYWPDGKVHTVTDPIGATTTTTYTARGMVASMTEQVTGELDRTTSYAYDDVGRLDRVVQPDGTDVTHTYDRAGRLTSTSDPASGTTTYGYDGAGNRTSVTDDTGVTVTSTYDELGRLASTLDAHDNETVHTYDLAGRLTSTTTPEGVTTTYDHDPRGLQTSRTDGLGNTWQTVYDAAGRVDLEVDARGAETSYAYDNAGRLSAMVDDAGNRVEFGHDDAGQRTSLTDPRGKTWTYEHAPTGGLAAEVDPLGNRQEWSYDDAGRLTAHVDGRSVRQDYTLDLAGRRTAIDHPDGQVTFGYDVMGRRTSMVDETGTTTFGYEPATGRLASVASPAGTVAYGYDGAGRRTSMTTPVGTVTYGHDLAGRLDSVTDWNGDPVELTLDADGRRVGLGHANGTSAAWSFDDAGRLVDIEHRDGDGDVFESFAYTLDANGNRTAMSSSAGTESYTLNSMNQHTGVDYPDRPDVSFTYDGAGNRISETVDGAGTTTYGYDDASRLTSSGDETFTHDGDGNVTSAGDDTFTWDWDGRMSSATVDGTTTSFAHDADGLRVDVGGTGLVYDRAADGPVPALLSDGTTTWLGAGGGPVSAVTSSGSGAVHADALGSIRATTGPSGAVTGTAGYGVFGTRTGDVDRLGFTGAQQDPSGRVWLHARTYLPDVGRFASVDPVRPGGPGVAGHNPYTYVVNNPTTFVDPTGMSFDYAAVLGRGVGGALPGIAALGAATAAALVITAWLNCVVVATCSLPAPPGIIPGPAPNPGPDGPISGPGVPLSVPGAWSFGSLATDVQNALLAAGVTAAALEITPDMTIYRVFGGCAVETGRSWSPVDPRPLDAVGGAGTYRDLAGLPNCNTGRQLVTGELDAEVWAQRLAVAIVSDPLDGNIGGLPEIRFFNWQDVAQHVKNRRTVPLRPPL